MADDKSREDQIKEKYEILKSEHDRDRLVQQKDIAKGPAPRPNDEFIRQNTGQAQTDKQLQERAEQIVDRNNDQRQADRFEGGEQDRAGRQQGREGGSSGNRDRLRGEQGQGRDDTSARDRLRGEGLGGQSQQLGKPGHGRNDGIDR